MRSVETIRLVAVTARLKARGGNYHVLERNARRNCKA